MLKNSSGRLLVRVDGSPEIGLGHFVRCLALGQIAAEVFKVIFVCRVLPEGCLTDLKKNGFGYIQIKDEKKFYAYLKRGDVVVLDGYHFTEENEIQVKNSGCRVISIDDLFNRHFCSDYIINHGMGIQEERYSKELYTKVFHGTDYLLVRSNFYDVAKSRRIIRKVSSLYINMGGSDPMNITYNILEQLDTSEYHKIHVVLGAASNHFQQVCQLLERKNIKNVTVHYNLDQQKMQQIMEKCEIAICTPSGVAYELCCVGIGLVVCKTTDNQKYFFREFVARKLAFGVDSEQDDYIGVILTACKKLRSSIALVLEQVAIQRIYFNGIARENVLRILKD